MEHQEPKQNELRTTQNAGANQGAEGPSLRHKVTTGLFWTYAERILAQIVTTVVSLVLARLLSTDDYGAISLVMVIISICDVFVMFTTMITVDGRCQVGKQGFIKRPKRVI